jgi:NAD(P)-dependent dehydrogenase (short-subunit alcohol dehydrogenase family)
MHILITGTSRGIGLELCKQALERGDQVMAIARDPKKSEGLQALQKKYSSTLSTAAVDITDPNAAKQIAASIYSWPHLDVLINNAGVYEQGETLEAFQKSFHVNSVAPLFITRALFSKLREAKNPKAVHLSSLMGSIEDNSSGGSYAYRASKTALNMINKCMTVEETWLSTAVLHPGWVQTDMGGKNAPTLIPESAAGLWNVITKLTSSESGSFYDYRGTHLAW